MRSSRVGTLLASLFGCLLMAACAGDVSTNDGPGAACGPVTCQGNEYCCDAACGLCAPDGVACQDTCAK